jgi:opacity protein-like surface antigen
MYRLFFLFAGLLFALSGTAQNFRVPSVDDKRTGKVELTFQLFNTFDEDFTASNDVDVEQDDTYGFGLGVAYNFTEHWALGFDFNWSEPDYEVHYLREDLTEGRFKADADIFTGQLKGIYNFRKGHFTPYVEAGAGWTYYDSNVSDGDGFLYCYWHPFYGYICSAYTDTYDETNFSYGGGLGLRWEVNERLLLKTSYTLLAVDFNGSGSDPLLQSIKFEIGSRY